MKNINSEIYEQGAVKFNHHHWSRSLRMTALQSFRIPFFALVSLSCWLTTAAAEYHWPSPKFDAIEAFLYERFTEPPTSLPFTSLLKKCVPESDGRHIAAEWIRFVSSCPLRRLYSTHYHKFSRLTMIWRPIMAMMALVAWMRPCILNWTEAKYVVSHLNNSFP